MPFWNSPLARPTFRASSGILLAPNRKIAIPTRITISGVPKAMLPAPGESDVVQMLRPNALSATGNRREQCDLGGIVEECIEIGDDCAVNCDSETGIKHR